MADFSNIASFYDEMTGFDRRLDSDRDVIKNIIEKYDIKNALDAGCGTGVHTIILTELGVDTIGFDASPEMLARARENARNAGTELKLTEARFENIPENWHGKFDAVFCLANSLVGVETEARLLQALQSFHRALKPGGRAIIQLLNTPKFRASGTRIIRASGNERRTYVRFFDFDQHITRLNVLVIEREDDGIHTRLISESILAIDAQLLVMAAREAGLGATELYADMSLTTPFHEDSNNIVAVMTAE